MITVVPAELHNVLHIRQRTRIIIHTPALHLLRAVNALGAGRRLLLHRAVELRLEDVLGMTLLLANISVLRGLELVVDVLHQTPLG